MKNIKLYLVNLNKRVIFVIINILAFAIIFALTYQSKLYSDDLSLLQQVGEIQGNIIEKALKYGIKYHLTWGGRSIAAFLRVIFSCEDKILYDIVNSLVYVFFSNILYSFAYPRSMKKRELHVELLILIYCILWFTIPTFGQIALWLTGSIAYLWFGTIQLVVVLFFFRRAFDREFNYKNGTVSKYAVSLVMLVMGFLAGCASEPSSCMLIIASLVWIFYMIHIKNKVLLQDIMGMLGIILGFIFLFTAPGIYARGDSAVQTGNIVGQIFYRFVRQTYYSGKYLLVPLAFAIVPTFSNDDSLTDYFKKNKEQLVLIGMAFVNVYVMIFSPGSAVRIFFTSVMLIVAAAAITYRKYVAHKMNNMVIISFTLFFALLTMVSITTAVMSCKRTGKPLEMQMEYNSENIGQLF